MFQIFEHPWGLSIIAAVVALILLIIKAAFSDTHRWWLWFLPILIVSAAFALDHFVQTDSEKIRELIKAISKAVEDESSDAIKPLVSPSYRDSIHFNKDRLMAHCRTVLAQPLIQENITRIGQIKFSPPAASADVTCTIRVRFDPQSRAYSFKSEIFIKVEFKLNKTSDARWLMAKAEIVAIDFIAATWKDLRQPAW